MMKCIALGAVEFLIKPISEDKLRNIWQHVVHKAFNAGGNATSEPLKSVKEFVGSVLEIQQQNVASHNQVPEQLKNNSEINQNYLDSLPIDDFQDQINTHFVEESGELDSETKSVNNTYGCSDAKTDTYSPQPIAEIAIEVEEDCGNGSMETDKSSPKPLVSNIEDVSNHGVNIGHSNDVSSTQNVCGANSNRKKVKVDWTPDLHKKFVQAVEKLGVDQAIPSRILELMKVKGLTRHNIASHLQKYRTHRRHILPKEDIRRWSYPGDSVQRNYYQYHHRPVMAFPPYSTDHYLAPGQVYPVWGQQGVRPPHSPAWGRPSYPLQPVETWHWKPYGMHADTWGCPMLPLSFPPSSTFPQVQSAYGFYRSDHYGKNSIDPDPGEETIDEVVNEVISKPWLPLPLASSHPPPTVS